MGETDRVEDMPAMIGLGEYLSLHTEREEYKRILTEIAEQPMQFTMPRDDSYWSRLAMQMATKAREGLELGKLIASTPTTEEE